MNEEELKKIEDICNNATVGPWEGSDHVEGCSRMVYAPEAGRGNGGLIAYMSSGVPEKEEAANVKFIVNARESIPKLIEEIRRLRISKRKLESYKRAEKVCQEFRYQMTMACREDWNLVAQYLSHWMKVTGNIKFQRPKKLK